MIGRELHGSVPSVRPFVRVSWTRRRRHKRERQAVLDAPMGSRTQPFPWYLPRHPEDRKITRRSALPRKRDAARHRAVPPHLGGSSSPIKRSPGYAPGGPALPAALTAHRPSPLTPLGACFHRRELRETFCSPGCGPCPSLPALPRIPLESPLTCPPHTR